MSGSAERIYALVMRHIYIWRSSVMRLINSIYWPAVQMVMWGFMTQYLLPQASFVAQAAGVLLSGLLLWEVVVRGNLSLSIAFLEEMWSRNLGHLFVSPIRSWEMATGIIIAALLRTLLGLVPVSLMAWAFFGYSIYSLGLPLVAFFAILQMFSWSIGLAMSGMIMRVGQSAESFAWAAVFILMPVSGVYYPVTVLPHWLQVDLAGACRRPTSSKACAPSWPRRPCTGTCSPSPSACRWSTWSSASRSSSGSSACRAAPARCWGRASRALTDRRNRAGDGRPMQRSALFGRQGGFVGAHMHGGTGRGGLRGQSTVPPMAPSHFAQAFLASQPMTAASGTPGRPGGKSRQRE